MAQKELLKELIIRESKLIEELKAISTLIGVYNDSIIEGQLVDEQIQVTTTGNDTIPSKGKRSWENYTLLVLRKIGGKAKTAEVADAAIEANPGIEKKTIKSAIRAKLSIKYRDGTIDAVKTKNKKDGYVYEIKDTTMIRTK